MESDKGITFVVKNTLNIQDKGWIECKDMATGGSISLCENTELKLLDERSGIFKVKYGKYQNRVVKPSLNFIKEMAFEKFKGEPNQTAALLVKEGCLFFLSTRVKLVQPINISSGYYQILLPDRPRIHIPQIYYYSLSGSAFASTWFPLIQKNKEPFYLHLGSYSRGCLTVDYNSNQNINIWNKLYYYLISAKSHTGQLGILHVVN
jgi:hypothetical protein